MDLLGFWVVMAGVVAVIASSKGKSPGAWFLYGIFVWPIALAHILVTPVDRNVAERHEISAGGKKCPKCAEVIKAEAVVCRFCGNEDLGIFNVGGTDKFGRTVIDGRKRR